MYPVIWISNSFYLPSYFTVIALAYCIAVLYLYSRAKKFKAPISIAMDLALILMISGFIGSRAFHIVYEAPQFYLNDPTHIWKVWQGGFVFYGGFFTALACGWFYIKKRNENPYAWMDLMAPIIPLTYFIGRFGTLLSGSGYGAPTDLPWGIVYPKGVEAPAGVALHPTPIYAMIFEAMTLGFVVYLERTNRLRAHGQLFFVFLGLHGLGRLIVEQFRADHRGAELFSFSISSWISLSLIGLSPYFFRKLERAVDSSS